MRPRTESLRRLVTCDESWICYDGTARKIVWRKDGEGTAMTPKPDRHVKKRMLSIFWTVRGPIHWELLKSGTTVTSNVYCNQLKQVDLAYQVMRAQGLFDAPLIFHHDNAPPHRSRLTRDLISQELKWKQLQHPAYSPDLAPSDYWLFRSMKTFLRNKRFKNDDELENAIGQYLASKMGTDFFERGIMKLPSRWRLVVKNKGNYFIE